MSKRKGKKSKLFGSTAIVGMKVDVSRALRAGRSQIPEANRVAQEMGCGAPFRAADGMFVANENTKNRFIKESNKRRVDQGEPRLVNFDGGYRDET